MQPYANGSFAQDLLRTANRLRDEGGLDPTAQIDDAAAVVLTRAVAGAMRDVDHLPHVGELDFAGAVAGATFICFAASPILLSLRAEGHELTAFDVIARAGFAIYEDRSQHEAAEIIRAGIGTFNDIVAAAREHQNIREWSDHIWKVMLIYVMTGREECLSVLGRLYLALHDARMGEPSAHNA